MPRELHDASYLFQATNQMVDLRRQISDDIVLRTKPIIRQGKKIHDLQWIYGLYGALDGLSGSFSMLKYFFDVYYANSSLSSMSVADEVHDWMMTPFGILIVTAEATVLVGVSIIANQFSGMKRLSPNELQAAEHWPYIKQRIVEDWPYIRDSMKALKNGYKGVRNVFVFANLLGVGRDLRYMIMPTGLLLGALSAYNRPWLRKMRFERDSREKENRQLCKRLLSTMITDSSSSETTPHIQLENWRTFQQQTLREAALVREMFERQSQSDSFLSCAAVGQWTGLFDNQPKYQSFWVYAYLSAAFNGLLDAPYLVLGVVSLTAAVPSLWIFCAAALLSFICVITRLYEEHNLQREFLVTQLAVQSALYIRQLTGLFGELKIISAALYSPDLTPEERALLITAKSDILEALKPLVADSQRCQNELKRNSVLSFWSLVLCGLKNGVESFGVVASVMFAIASLYAMTMTAYPPFLLTFFMALGIGILLLFVIDSLLGHFEHWNEMSAAEEAESPGTMLDCVQELTADLNSHSLQEENQVSQQTIENQIDIASSRIREKMTVIPSRQYFYQYWFEVPRLLFSGIGKGIRIMDTLLVAEQTLGDDGHYHDTDNMMIAAKISAFVVAIVFALRGFANASDKSLKQNARNDSPPDDRRPSPQDSGDESPTKKQRRTPSPSLPGAWLPFFQQNTPTMPPSMKSTPALMDLGIMSL